MVWSTGSGSNARLNPILCWRRNVWPADSGVIATDKGSNHVVQPIRIRHAVGIGIGQDFAFGRRRPCVAGVTQSMIRLMDVVDRWELGCDVRSVISRTIVYQNDFVSRI